MIAPSESPAVANALAEIETQCARYEDASAALEEMIAALEADLEAVKHKHLRIIKRHASNVAALQANLQSAIERSPELFKKPRTLTLHGVKVGLTNSVGKLAFEDAETVVALIKQHFGRSADTYLRSFEEPNKDALKTLDADELQKLGCEIEGAGDVVVLKRVAGDGEKLVNKLIEKFVEAMVQED